MLSVILLDCMSDASRQLTQNDAKVGVSRTLARVPVALRVIVRLAHAAKLEEALDEQQIAYALLACGGTAFEEEKLADESHTALHVEALARLALLIYVNGADEPISPCQLEASLQLRLPRLMALLLLPFATSPAESERVRAVHALGEARNSLVLRSREAKHPGNPAAQPS